MKEYPEISKFGNRVRALREAKKWTQMDLAVAVNSDSTYISRVERGKTNPSLVLIILIAHALEVTLDELFTF